ncbi:hypothetical protein PLEOSDRAFT_1107671 [Pleurotus ostreatus PC15]|uniref:Uncharacterized protein n=1 Tax=Pleurotus ostreatus (strain PC15) TaxID=1137138 RepID=A0A067NCQ7_PLEO1|nr:hypothetical protein PLEOSDRAFT_1107671 [Pleurotus ostreatus PC15]
MSCTICRLPFVLNPRRPEESIDMTMSPPIAAPEGTLTKHQHAYFSMYRDRGQRSREEDGVHQCVAAAWQRGQPSSGGTLFVMHVTCADILRRIFDAEDTNAKSLARVSQIEEVVGKVQGGASAGWLPLVRYKEVGEKIDLAPFWSHQPDTPSMGSNVFDWTRLENSRYKWLVNRPDVCVVYLLPCALSIDSDTSDSRSSSPRWTRSDCLGGDDFEVEEGDTLSDCPLALLYLLLLPYLSPRSYAMLASSSRLFRYNALTIFQPHTRDLVITFAGPHPQSKNTKSRPRRSVASWRPKTRSWRPSMGIMSKGMRVRRWILGECEEVKRVYEERLQGSPYAITAGRANGHR